MDRVDLRTPYRARNGAARAAISTALARADGRGRGTRGTDFGGSGVMRGRSAAVSAQGFRANEESRFPIFAFRLHQLFTCGDTVWTTLEPGSVQHIGIAKLGAKPGEPDKPLFPLVFCRHCGTEYYGIAFYRDGWEARLESREDRGDSSDDSVDAWLYASGKAPWPRAGEEQLSRLPLFMKELSTGGRERVRTDVRMDGSRDGVR